MEKFCWARLVMISLLLHVLLIFLVSVPPVHCDDEEDHLLQAINTFRRSAHAPSLSKHDEANCVADEIADKFKDRACASTNSQSQIIPDYVDVLNKCKVNVNTTRDGLILPVCVPHRVATLVLTNYTMSQNSRFLNDTRFTGAGIGTENDWTVLVLTTSTLGGRFTSSAIQLGSRYLPLLFLMSFVVYIY